MLAIMVVGLYPLTKLQLIDEANERSIKVALTQTNSEQITELFH